MDNAKNSVRLTGYAGTDPIIVNFASDKKMARVSVAVNEFYKNSLGEPINQTQWFNLIFWNKKVELVENLVKKGTNISIEGKLSTQSYTDKKGEQRVTIEIIVNALEMISVVEG
jgi:single-strand DNA-binding protein